MSPQLNQPYAPIWQTIQQLQTVLPSFYMPALQTAMTAQDLGELPLGMLIHAYDVHPDPLTADLIQTCVPYYHTQPFTERIEKITAAGLFQTSDQHHYTLTEDAYQRVDTVYQAIYTALGQIDVLNKADLDWLVATFQGILERSLANIALTPAASMEYKPERTQNIAPLAKLSATVDVLYSLRCDAHQTAWRDLTISPPAIEIWTVIWRGEADTVQGVVDVLHNDFPRGYTLTEYQTFTDELLACTWITSEDGIHYRLTSEGQTQRDTIEAETDRLFYAGWANLPDVDITQLADLSEKLIDELRVLTG